MKKAIPNAPNDTEPKAPKQVWRTAPSLKPGPEVSLAAAEGQPYAVAIRDAWRCQHPVKTLSREEYEALVERCSVSF